MTDIQEWAEDICRETCHKWKSFEGRYEFWKRGFAVFYSPVYANPDLMIIGFNPGGDEGDFEEEKQLKPPAEHDYFKYDYRLAKKMKSVFEEIGRTSILEKSIKFNLIFFSSENKAALFSVGEPTLTEIKTFCHRKVRDIITLLKPKMIITEGVETYDDLLMLLEEQPSLKRGNEKIERDARRRFYCSCDYGNIRIIGLLHLSGAWPGDRELEKIEENLRGDMEDALGL